MKTYLNNLKDIRAEKNEVVITGDKGSLCLKILTSSIIHFAYHFKNIKVCEQASTFIGDSACSVDSPF